MNCQTFIEEQIAELQQTVGDGIAINAMSGGVDSSVVTVLAHRALGSRLKTILVDNALMREGEPERVVRGFAALGIPVELVNARKEFLDALKGLTDPEAKRAGDHPDLLPGCFRGRRAPERRPVFVARHHPDGHRGDGGRDQAPAQYSRSTGD